MCKSFNVNYHWVLKTILRKETSFFFPLFPLSFPLLLFLSFTCHVSTHKKLQNNNNVFLPLSLPLSLPLLQSIHFLLFFFFLSFLYLFSLLLPLSSLLSSTTQKSIKGEDGTQQPIVSILLESSLSSVSFCSPNWHIPSNSQPTLMTTFWPLNQRLQGLALYHSAIMTHFVLKGVLPQSLLIFG